MTHLLHSRRLFASSSTRPSSSLRNMTARAPSPAAVPRRVRLAHLQAPVQVLALGGGSPRTKKLAPGSAKRAMGHVHREAMKGELQREEKKNPFPSDSFKLTFFRAGKGNMLHPPVIESFCSQNGERRVGRFIQLRVVARGRSDHLNNPCPVAFTSSQNGTSFSWSGRL